MKDIEKFFKPKSLAIVGATLNPTKVGYSIVKNIKDANYKGKVYCVNPNYTDVMGFECYPDMDRLPEAPDLAILVIPPKACIDALDKLGRIGTKAVVVISAGFGETEEGKRLQDELLSTARKYGIRLVGPNCLGVMDTHSNLNATFARVFPPKGPVGVISQSGAVLSAFFDWALDERVGFSKVVSLGNQADLTATEFIEFLADDPETEIILMYIEGLKDGRRFIEAASKASLKKPIVAIKVGRTASGKKAASSHTGSITGSDTAYDAAFKKAGILRVNTLEELFDIARLISSVEVKPVERIGIVTNAGGPGIIASDAIESSTLKLAELSKKTIERLKEKLPPMANFYNPVDVIGDADHKRYEWAIEALLDDENVDAILVILTPQLMTDIPDVAKSIVKHKGRKPIIASFIGRARVSEGTRILRENGIPNFPFPERGIKALDTINRYLKEKHYSIREDVELVEKIRSSLIEDIQPGRSYPEFDSLKILEKIGFPVAKAILVRSKDEAERASLEIGFPLVLKVYDPEILHKSDIGGVVVGIRSTEELLREIDGMGDRVRKKLGREPEGYVIEEMVGDGIDIIIGFSKDDTFGPMTMFGLGGIFVEVLKDVSFSVSPTSVEEAIDMIKSIKSYKILTGIRGGVKVDIESLAKLVSVFSHIPIAIDILKEGEINPLRITKDGRMYVVDARFIS